MRRVAIVSPIRTAVGKYLGVLSGIPAGELGAVVAESELGAALKRVLSVSVRSDLPSSVSVRFGPDVFGARLRAVFARLNSSELVAA